MNTILKSKKVIALVLIILFAVLGTAYFTNSLEKYGLCKPGTESMKGPFKGLFGERFCYTPSGYEGMLCDKSTDCGTAACVLVDENKAVGKGKCYDVIYGCVSFIDKNGDSMQQICID